jgi:hypothetical protein
MKTLLLLLVLFVAAPNGISQYQIDWFTVDGGGGASSGGPYTLSGTIGQPEAATSIGGAYTLQGGFWSGIVPAETGPALRIFITGEKLILAWPNPSTGFQLQYSVSLTAPNWTNVTDAPSIAGAEKQVRQERAPAVRFYRLRKP